MSRLLRLPLIVVVGLLAVAATSRSDEKDDAVAPGWTADFSVEKDELVSTGRNPYFILEPGYQLVLEGGKERLVITVLDETKTVDGVETRVVEERETKDGKLVEVSRNFFAISKRTNSVFYFGEDVDIYKDGKVVRHEGAWLSGVKDAKFGLMMPGQVLLKARYYQEIAPKVAMDRAEVVSLRETVKTPAGEFMNCLKTEETTPLEPGEKEYKYYARGIGLLQDGSLKLVKYGHAEQPKERAVPEVGKADEPADSKIVSREDVVYGHVNGAGLLADIAFPESKEPLPAIISVHGGRWVGGHKRDASTIKVEQWAGFGFFAMSIDYRLKNCTPAPACYQDCQCAIRYVHAHAKEYNIDTSRIFLIGQSAGGHMVSLAATLGDGPYPRTGGWDQSSNEIRAAISVAAAYDLTTLDWGNLWTPPGVDPDEARAQASPTRHVTAKSKPLLVLHSDNDRSVPIANALTMIEVLKKADARHTFHRYPEMGHMGITDEVIARTREFIKEVSANTTE